MVTNYCSRWWFKSIEDKNILLDFALNNAHKAEIYESDSYIIFNNSENLYKLILENLNLKNYCHTTQENFYIGNKKIFKENKNPNSLDWPWEVFKYNGTYISYNRLLQIKNDYLKDIYVEYEDEMFDFIAQHSIQYLAKDLLTNNTYYEWLSQRIDINDDRKTIVRFPYENKI